MSVYTAVDAGQLSPWLSRHGIGAPTALTPIPEGIENTNYFVTTGQGEFVLTLFERLTSSELEFYLALLSHLAAQGIPCPTPLTDDAGVLLGELNGKPAAIMSRLPGKSALVPGQPHCAAVGTLLAELHLAAESFTGAMANPRGLDWCREVGAGLATRLPENDRALLEEELRFQALCGLDDLPRGICHCDVFRDNVLFAPTAESSAPRVSGIIDFYLAGTDDLLFDLAVVANDWCVAGNGDLDPERLGALLRAYHAVRPLDRFEQAAWPAALRRAALRFWLSRLQDSLTRRSGVLTYAKDPAVFGKLLRRHIQAGSDQPWV